MIGQRRTLTFEIINEEFPALTPSMLDVIDGLSSEMGCVPWRLTLVRRLMNEFADLILWNVQVGELSRDIRLAWNAIDRWAEIKDCDFGNEYDKWKKQISESFASRRDEARKVYDTWAFFSRPDALAKTEFWKNAAALTASEATALSFGKEPTVVSEVSITEFAPPPCGSPFKEDFLSRLDLIKRSQLIGELPANISLADLLKWAQRRNITLELDQKAFEVFVKSTPQLSICEEKGLSPKSRNYLYRMILGMAISRYGYITDRNDGAAKAIALELQELGLMGINVELGDDVVLKHLASAAQTLSVRTLKAVRSLTNLPSLQSPLSDSKIR